MGPWNKFESTVVRLKRNYEDTGSEVCLTTKGRQLERNFEELKPASHVPIQVSSLRATDCLETHLYREKTNERIIFQKNSLYFCNIHTRFEK
jgi:hypothetical protein